MDLLTQLKTLRDTTKSPEVRSICESNIQKLQNGETVENVNSLFESANSVEAPVSVEKDPYSVIRDQELERSKNVAQRLMESWGGLNSFKPQTSAGTYVDGLKPEAKKDDYSAINESLSALAEKDPSAASFIKSQRVNNLGVFESILNIKDSGIFEHPQVKVLCEKYFHLLKNKNLPEFLVAESFVYDLKNFSWDSKLKSIYESIGEKLSSLKPEIEVSKAIYAIEQNAGSDFYSPVTESLNKWLISENKSVSLLNSELSRWQFNPAVRNLLNTLSLMENQGDKLNIPIHAGNSSVRRIYSPVLVSGGKSVFTIGNNVFEGSNSGVRRLSGMEISSLEKDFISVLESFYSPYVKVDEKGLNIFVGKNKYSIIEENDSKSIYNNGTKVKFNDLTHLSRMLSLEISGTSGVNENRVIFDIINLFENFDTIVELDFAKRIESKVYEGASVNLIKWNGEIYLNRINESMKDNSLFKVNGTQASGIVKDFLKYDISEGLTEFLEGESKVRSIMLNDRSKLIENISIIENEILKLESKMSGNPLYANSTEMKRAKFMLEQELNSLRTKWSTVNEELEKLDSGSTEILNVNEDDKFNVGEYIKVKESGNTGKIISIDGTSGSYTVLMDNGKTGDFRVDEIINLDDALASAGEENEEEAETQEEIKEQELAVAPGKDVMEKTDKSLLSTMKKNTTAAPTGKQQDSDGKKDVENLKDANLEEAPKGQKLTDYKANAEAGYNIAENEETLEEKAEVMKIDQELAKAPGKEEGDANYDAKTIHAEEKNPEVMKIDQNFASAPGDDKGKSLDYEVNKEMGYNMHEKAEIMKTDQQLAKAPGQVEGDAGYKTQVTEVKEKSPEVMDIDPNFASAPGDDKGKTLDYEANKDMGYNMDEKAELIKADQQLAKAPGKIEGDADYAAKTVHAEKKATADIQGGQNLAEAPSQGAEGDVDHKVNSEMGYNIKESEESKKN